MYNYDFVYIFEKQYLGNYIKYKGYSKHVYNCNLAYLLVTFFKCAMHVQNVDRYRNNWLSNLKVKCSCISTSSIGYIASIAYNCQKRKQKKLRNFGKLMHKNTVITNP